MRLSQHFISRRFMPNWTGAQILRLTQLPREHGCHEITFAPYSMGKESNASSMDFTSRAKINWLITTWWWNMRSHTATAMSITMEYWMVARKAFFTGGFWFARPRKKP